MKKNKGKRKESDDPLCLEKGGKERHTSRGRTEHQTIRKGRGEEGLRFEKVKKREVHGFLKTKSIGKGKKV